jgi:glucokinase
VRLENDADAAALGEYAAGAGRGAHSMVMLTFGTGIGGGVILDGPIYRGAAGAHPELGHMHAETGGPACYCGAHGCLESIAAGPAISAAAQAAGMADAREAFSRAAARDPAAAAVIGRAVRAAAAVIWDIAHTFLPERVILGGGIMEEHFDVFAPEARKRLEAAAMVPKGAVTVVRAALGNAAGVVGAAALAWQPPVTPER